MLSDLSRDLAAKKISPVELLNETLGKIEKHDGTIKAFLAVEKEQALEAAKKSAERIQQGKALSPYDGIPIGIKDNIVTAGRVTQCASKILDGFISPYSSTVIEKLQALGFVTIGRLNMDEFAMGSSTENSAFQITRNPFDTERAPGGSSGGSAAAVAAGFLPVALGSDTGGSIRQPAAFCGLSGLKPTYGTVSRYGLVAFASSLDQIGPLAHTVADVEIVHNAIKGFDPKDSTTMPDSAYKKWSGSLGDIRLGVDEKMLEGLSAEVRESFDKTLNFLKGKVKSVSPVSLPNQKYGIPVYYLVATSEASANLARFDGVRYGHRSGDAKNLAELYEKSRTEGFGPEVKRRILLGTYSLSSGYYDAFYGKAQAVRALIQKDYNEAFQKVDAILMPATPSPAFKIGEKTSDPVQMYLSDVLTVGASLAGVPALSVPGPAAGLPIGMQLQGPNFSEDMLFALGKAVEAEFPQKRAAL
ncbi:MAG: Asp-tRNA(Asn)/Glu-tRNA(Gln) amidotransferase subunit GatA [Turneriella sp.]|nr:Asp-tRNA(Asn)/Glu-tRNA(Gln) amidotransferase subunit GatA [Turneriella sp.]